MLYLTVIPRQQSSYCYVHICKKETESQRCGAAKTEEEY